MRDTIAHTHDVHPRYFGMALDEVRRHFHNFGNVLTNRDQAHRNAMLNQLILKKVSSFDAPDEAKGGFAFRPDALDQRL